jgi:hypothetical protein
MRWLIWRYISSISYYLVLVMVIWIALSEPKVYMAHLQPTLLDYHHSPEMCAAAASQRNACGWWWCSSFVNQTGYGSNFWFNPKTTFYLVE